jgi:AAA domain
MSDARVTGLPYTTASGGIPADYIEPIAKFLGGDDPPITYIIPEIVPHGVLVLVHGEPRSRKSFVALELALAAATGSAAFGLQRFEPAEPVTVLYVQEEDPRSLTRQRLRPVLAARCGASPPETFHVAVRRGVDLDDPLWVDRLITDLKGLGATLLVLDAARRLSAKTDEGPTKVRELTRVLRAIVTAAGVAIVIVHHDVKPAANGHDQRRRSQRASGGDWFAACECPIHVEKLSKLESLVFPEDFKFGADPEPFTFTTRIADGLITSLAGADTTTEAAEHAGLRGKVLDWLRAHGPATRSKMRDAGLGQWAQIEAILALLTKEGKVDEAPGRQRNSPRYFLPEPSRLSDSSRGQSG